ncbi:MAG: DNA adenine methylase [Methanosarcinaceae archaeon]
MKPETKLKPFLRYPGGKGRMLNFLSEHLLSSPAIKGRYIEPFVGGGSVYFFTQPTQAVLSDINQDLINLYVGIQQDAKSVWKKYITFGDTKDDYFHVRDEYSPRGLSQKAARTLFLNRTCFKGMWRHNKNGDFNVGYGGQDRRWVINEENLLDVQEEIKNTTLMCSDFGKMIDASIQNDFIFVDPPYRPAEKEQLHNHYVGRIFTFNDHVRLSKSLHKASARNVQWALTISSHPEILNLYSENRILLIPRGTGSKPGATVPNSGEVLILNYHLH